MSRGENTAECRANLHLEGVVQGLRLQLKKAAEQQRQDKSRAIQAFCSSEVLGLVYDFHPLARALSAQCGTFLFRWTCREDS